MFRITNEPPTPLATLRPDLPPELGECVARAMAKQPQDRFQTGAQMAAELRRLIALIPDETPPTAPFAAEVTLPLSVSTVRSLPGPDQPDIRL